MISYRIYVYEGIRDAPRVIDTKAQNISNLRRNLIKKYSNMRTMVGICVYDSEERLGWLNVNNIDVNGNIRHVWTIGRSSDQRLVNPKTGALL